MSVTAQSGLGFGIEKFLPFNHYCRKMLGYLYAIKCNASTIIDTDDDNIPYENWDFPEFDGEFDTVKSNLGFVNIYSLFTQQRIWPRGLPLEIINQPNTIEISQKKQRSVGVWQGLADGDPDVDAIYRLTSDEACNFTPRSPVCVEPQTFCPFNSQNTAFRRELFPLLYLPTTVTFRYTDILRSTVAQPIMWANGFHLGFTGATVVQKRNPHDYIKDFESEVPMYLTNKLAYSVAENAIRRGDSISQQLLSAYEALAERGIVKSAEIETLTAWLDDLCKLKF